MKPEKIFFIEGVAFDIIITTVGVLDHRGQEGDIFLTWIHPQELMIAGFILNNLIFVALCLNLPEQTEKRWGKKALHYSLLLLVIMGAWRILCGISWFGLKLY